LPSARQVVIVAVAIIISWIVYGMWSATRDPEGSRYSASSYGTRAHGYRAFYELLPEIGVPVSRSLAPPSTAMQDNRTLAFVNPDASMVETERGYIRHARRWMDDGGSVVYVLSANEPRHRRIKSPFSHDSETTFSLMAELGLEGIQTVEVRTTPTKLRRELADASEARTRRMGFTLDRERPLTVTPIEGPAAEEGATTTAAHLYIPSSELRVVEIGSTATQPSIRYTLRSRDQIEYTLAAVFPRGRGQLILITESELLLNHAIAENDNASFAARLFALPGKPIIFDEFYHGMIVRGNPLWLFTRAPYGLIALLVVLATGVWVLRRAVWLGPPLAEPRTQRRSIVEYVDAMASLFQHRRYRSHVLKQLWRDTLWMVRKQKQLSPRLVQPEEIAAAIERTEPGLARHLRHVSNLVESRLSSAAPLSQMQSTELAREITKCLS
jgi:hypothetical protein